MEPPVKITGTRYVLSVKDLAKSPAYYQKQLGLTTWWAGEGWHFLRRGNFMVMLGECADDLSAYETNNHSYFAYIEVENIEALYQEYFIKAVEILQELSDKPWGQREFAIRTIDGHRIMFGEELNSLS
jgi:catechol 2,3-dioxygenase-like lactoylglutathione lyase family enzyme